MLLNKIDEWEEKGKIAEEEIIKKFNIINKYNDNLSDFDRWFYKRLIYHLYLPKLLNCIDQILRIKRLLFYTLSKAKQSYGSNFQDKIEIARNKPIIDIASNFLDLKKISDKHVALCPFHKEKTASFYIYPNTNSFYCFGCRNNGDVISLVMKLQGFDFKQAVNYLN
ncbi:MAG: hypothetical protein GF347_01775 [Candidatus Moranbacteria bacterium]|nr:hypothetical protein [Candidatus Moranbacteria bacterium]